MSTSDPKTATMPARPRVDPKALSTEYHKARKQLMLWAGILFIWELVGIDLEIAKEAGGNPGALVKSIKSPQAIPWVLVILVGYFLFKTTIEWHQCNEGRRRLRASKIDFISTWVVSGLAYALYVGQAIGRVQFADLFDKVPMKGPLLSGFSLAVFYLWFLSHRKTINRFALISGLLAASLTGLPFVLLAAEIRGSVVWWFFLGGATVGVVFVVSVIALWKRRFFWFPKISSKQFRP